MANFFIDRPIFAWVLAILLCLTGVLAITSLPVEQYPDLAPPNVRVTANYPGASAQTLEKTRYGAGHGHPELHRGYGSGRSGAAGAKPAAVCPA